MTTLLLDRPALPVDDATRREFLIGGAAAAVLAGCGRDDPTGPTAPVSGDDFPVFIDHKYGSTEIPAEPTRVVCAGLVEHDALLALGVVPVGVTDQEGKHPGGIYPWARRALGDAPAPAVLQFADGLQFERIAALQSDLILAMYSGITRADYDRLIRIAPTVAQPTEYIDYGVPWQDLTRITGRAVGRAEQAEQLIAGIGARFAKARSEHPEFIGVAAAVAGGSDGNYYAFASGDSRARLMTDLGFVMPTELNRLAGDQFFVEIGAERLDLFDTDVLVWELESANQREELRANPLYSRLRVSKQGRDVFLAGESDLSDAFARQTVLSLPFLINELVPRLASAVDGDPITEVPR